MPLFKRSKIGLTSNQIVLADIKAEVIDTDLITGVSSAHDTLASALAVKNYIDNEIGAFDTFKELLDTDLDDTTSSLSIVRFTLSLLKYDSASLEVLYFNISSNKSVDPVIVFASLTNCG